MKKLSEAYEVATTSRDLQDRDIDILAFRIANGEIFSSVQLPDRIPLHEVFAFLKVLDASELDAIRKIKPWMFYEEVDEKIGEYEGYPVFQSFKMVGETKGRQIMDKANEYFQMLKTSQ